MDANVRRIGSNILTSELKMTTQLYIPTGKAMGTNESYAGRSQSSAFSI